MITSVEKGVARQTNSFFLAGTGEDDKRFEDEEKYVLARTLLTAGPVDT